MKKHIPNFTTSLNLVSGFLAIVFAVRGDIITAAYLILAAMIFDFFDGFLARILHSYSELGKELDSLADLVSFGVAPSIIILQMLGVFSIDTFNIEGGLSGGIPAVLIISIMPVCAALRLAKFNIDSTQATGFKGLPTPANALAVISVVIAGHYSEAGFINKLAGSSCFLMIFTILLSLLMVSRIPLLSLKTNKIGLAGNEGRYLIVLLAGLSLIFFGISAATLVIPIYIVVSLIAPYLTR